MTLVLPGWPPEADEGVRLFNAAEYFEAHEAWETVWHRTDGHVARYWQGLIQAAAAMVKVQRGERVGAVRLLEKAIEKLSAVVPVGAPIRTEMLLGDCRRLLADLGRLTDEQLAESGIPRSAWLGLHVRGADGRPGLIVTSWPFEAVEGVRRFDAGDWWEAHEHFERCLEEAPGEEALLYKALIHAGSCLLKLSRHRERPARTLGESALRLLEWLDPIELPESAHVRLDGLTATLRWVLQQDGLPEPVPTPRLTASPVD